MRTDEFDLYTDYLISQFGATMATGLSALLDGEISHDKVTRFLSERLYSGRDLWLRVKPVIRRIEDEEGCLIIDDTIEEKGWADENDLICWHFGFAVRIAVSVRDIGGILLHPGRNTPNYTPFLAKFVVNIYRVLWTN
jgi:hypothetical protein